MSTNIVLLDPSDNTLITIDWADVLASGITLSSVTHTVPSPLAKGTETTNSGTGQSQVKVSGAVHGAMYMVEAQATLSNGDVVNRQFPVRGWNS